MSSNEIKNFKEELAMLKRDIKVLNDIVKYADENIDCVTPATVRKFQDNIDELAAKLKVVIL